jgi:hypothetical protein
MAVQQENAEILRLTPFGLPLSAEVRKNLQRMSMVTDWPLLSVLFI